MHILRHFTQITKPNDVKYNLILSQLKELNKKTDKVIVMLEKINEPPQKVDTKILNNSIIDPRY
jgi:hypothetical protein